MAKARKHPAPETLGLIVQINDLLRSRGMTRGDFREVVNEFLTDSRKIPATHSGEVQLNRWLDPTGKDWPEPRSEIILAFQKASEKIIAKNS